MSNSVKVQYTEKTGDLRVYYDKPNGYAERAEYDAIVGVIWVTARMAQLHGGHGELNKRALLKIAQQMFDKGAERLLIQRAKGKHVPWGVLMHSEDQEDTYLVNLLEMLHKGLIRG